MEAWENLSDAQKDLVRLNQQGLQARLDRIETKLDEVLAFRDLILETAGPFLSGGKGKVWMALLAKSKGARS